MGVTRLASGPAQHGERRTPPTTGRAVAVVVTLVVFSALVLGATIVTGVFPAYTLDDPYIHLSLSRTLRHGTYGLVSGTPVAPASSVLWPLLLVPTAGTPVHEATPLLLNAVALGACAAVMYGSLDRAYGRAGDRGLPAAGMTIAVTVFSNLIGVSLIGMEHTLHSLLALMVASGLHRAALGESPPRHTWVALALLPLVRYEGLAIAVPAAVALGILASARRAAASLVVGVVGLGAFTAMLLALDLHPIPASVLVKAGQAPESIPARAFAAFLEASIPVFAAAASVVLARWHLQKRDPFATAAVALAATLVVQVLVGPTGSHSRYEIWAVVYGTVLLLLLGAPVLRTFAARAGRLAPVALAATLVIASGGLYVRTTFLAPVAALDINQQHGTVALFARELDRPLAANDIGLLTYRTGHPPLDLWGLASQEARDLRYEGNENWMHDLVTRHGVDTVVIYPEWFGDAIPSTWIPVGRIGFDRPPFFAAVSWQVVYGTDAAAVERARAALEAVQRSRPANVEVFALNGGVGQR